MGVVAGSDFTMAEICLAERGLWIRLARLVTGGVVFLLGLIGVLGGVGQKTNPLKVLSKAINLKGVEVGSRRSLVDMTRAIALNGLEPVIDRRFAFADAPDAYRYLASGAHFGKITIEHP